jgi:cytidylate kinase
MMAGAPAGVSSNVIAMVVAIDGPAGAGKSTVARAAAERLGFTYLDSGAMYRAVALAAQDGGDADVAALAEAADIRVGDRVLLDGEDVTDAIRTPEVTERSSRISTDHAVRAALVRKQRAMLAEGDWVAEGRDIGTVVCPEAEVRVFLTARPEVRARRRADQFGEDYETVLADIAARDRRDMEREHSPLTPAADAVPVDTSDLDLDGVLEQIETLVVEAREMGP